MDMAIVVGIVNAVLGLIIAIVLVIGVAVIGLALRAGAHG
jgi:hypothetical protein